MKTLNKLSLLILFFYSLGAYAGGSATSNDPKSPVIVEAELGDQSITLYAAETPEELAKAQKLAVEKATENGGQVSVTSLTLEGPGGDASRALHTRETAEAVAAETQSDVTHENVTVDETEQKSRGAFLEWAKRNNLILLSVIRGLANGTGVTATVFISDAVPIELALFLGTLAGSASGAFQYTNSIYMPWVERPGPIARWVDRAFGPRVGKPAALASSYYKWYLIEVGFLAVIELLRDGLSVGPDLNFTGHVVKVLSTALYGVLAQGPWEIVIQKFRSAALLAWPKKQDSIKTRANVAVFTASLLSVTAAAASLMGNEVLSFSVFGAMGALGTATLFFEKRIKKHLGLDSCEGLLKDGRTQRDITLR